jgi:Na+-translocating ferredoxin:NAD+ oxidoreductase subunit G
VSVIRHTETPGLGSQVENPEFLEQFSGKTVDDSIEVGVDVDAIAGATISVRAVAEDLREALHAFELIRAAGR